MLVFKETLLIVLAVAPAATLTVSLEPSVTSPALVKFEPTVQFADATLDFRIDLLDLIDPVSPDLKSVKRRLCEYPVGLPVVIPLEQKLVLEIAMPHAGIVFPLPFLERNRPERLFDLAQLPRSSATALEIAVVMHDDAANHFKNRFKGLPIWTIQSTFTQRVIATPPALVGLFQRYDLVTILPQGLEFASGGAYLPVLEIMRIEHDNS